MAAVVQIFDELTAAVKEAQTTAGADPVRRLLAGCQAYLEYGLGHPARYGLLFAPRALLPDDYCPPPTFGADGHPDLHPEHPANAETPNPDVGSGCPRCLATSQWRPQ